MEMEDFFAIWREVMVVFVVYGLSVYFMWRSDPDNAPRWLKRIYNLFWITFASTFIFGGIAGMLQQMFSNFFVFMTIEIWGLVYIAAAILLAAVFSVFWICNWCTGTPVKFDRKSRKGDDFWPDEI